MKARAGLAALTLFASALGAPGLGAQSAAPAPAGTTRRAPAIPPLVQSEWLAAELARPDLVILQIASDSAFAAGHIPGAVPIDFQRDLVAPPVEGGLRTELPAPGTLEAALRARGVTPTSRVVLVFDTPASFTRAGRAFFTLEWAGLAGRVAVLDGGLPKWRREGRVVATGAAKRVATGTVTVAPAWEVRATRDDVRALIGQGGTRIVDARDSVFFLDERPNGMARGGRIASAVSLPFSTVTNADGTLKPREELARLVGAVGVTEGERLVSYCHIGMQASWMYLALRVLGRDVRMYDGAFDEWSRDASLPVEGARARP